MGRARISLLCAVAALLLAAPLAHASAFDKIFRAYQQHGKIDACAFSDAALQQAKSHVPNDIEAYAPDFPNALQAAIEARAGGACKSTATGATGTAATPGAAGTSGTSGTTAPPGSAATTAAPAPPGATVTPGPQPEPTAAAAASDQAIARSARLVRDSNAGTPAPVVALGLLGALLALGGLVYALAHWLAWDPRWGRSARHALGEAGWRTSNTWSEFTDWVRLGR